YLGLLLALPHAIWTGTDLSSSRGAKLYWVALHAAALGAVLVWRVAVPVRRSVRHRIVVDKVVPESPGVVSIYLTGRDLPALDAAAGQFFTWRFRSGPGWTRGHPFSLSEAPRGDRLRITVKDLGDGSHALTELRPGTRALIEGPYGRLHPGVRTRQKVTLIGAGIGIAPLRALLEALDVAPGDLTMICRAHDEESLALRSEIDALAASSGARVFHVVGPRVTDRASWLPVSAAHLTDVQALRELVPDIAGHDVFLCGADAWMDAVRAAALEAGVPSAAIHRERFSW
ncbi:MAG: hypothetical protein QG622_3020, partial [Actinomycetota bacterium]|nr:hypothetical protein [Actinomycetota bacterium]